MPGLRVSADLPFLPLETERLVLRLAERADAERLSALSNDAAVVRHTAHIPYPNPVASVREFLVQAEARLASGRELLLVITLCDGGAIAGAVGLEIDGLRRQAEIGYWLGQAYWGKGYMTEAVRAVAGLALGRLGLQRLHATTATANPASQQVLRKAGFAETGPAAIDLPARGEKQVPAARFERTAPRPPLLVAAVALIDADERVLLAQRPPGKSMAGLWEFPGGKVDPGETPEAALIRELREELAVDTAESCLSPFTFASHAYDDFHLLMPLYVCRVWKGRPTPLEGQTLAWVRPNQMKNYPMPPADKPLVAMLRDLL